MMAQEEAILKAEVQFDEMIDLVRQASASHTSIDQVERDLWHRLLDIGRAMLEGYVAEGACRHLVKDRTELTGMRWRTEGAQAMLDLRAVYLNDDWDAFQKHRIKQERRRLYPYLRMVRREWKTAA